MICTECGLEIGDNQKFCKYCGAPVKQMIFSAENAGRAKCRGCGAILKPGIAFCTQCGTPVSADDVKISEPKKKNKPKGSKAWKIIIALITIIGLLMKKTGRQMMGQMRKPGHRRMCRMKKSSQRNHLLL